MLLCPHPISNIQADGNDAQDSDILTCGMWTCQPCRAAEDSLKGCDLQTPDGNVLWDCLSHLDEETLQQIQALGGLKAIAISHPHFYDSCLDWAEAFSCQVRLLAESMHQFIYDNVPLSRSSQW